jgi:hypothetical protein
MIVAVVEVRISTAVDVSSVRTRACGVLIPTMPAVMIESFLYK